MTANGRVVVMAYNSHLSSPGSIPLGQPNLFYHIATKLDCGNDGEVDREVMCR